MFIVLKHQVMDLQKSFIGWFLLHASYDPIIPTLGGMITVVEQCLRDIQFKLYQTQHLL